MVSFLESEFAGGGRGVRHGSDGGPDPDWEWAGDGAGVAPFYPGGGEHLVNVGVGKARPAMGQLGSDVGAIVFGEVDQQERAAGGEDSGGFADGTGGVLGVVQYHLQDDGVEGLVGERQAVHVGEADGGMGETGAGEARAGEREHGFGGVDTECLADPGCEEFEDPAGAGADIEQADVGLAGDQGEKRLFDGLGGKVEGAHFVPVGAFVAEAFRGDAGAFGEDSGGLAAIGFEDGVVGGEAGDEFARQGAGFAGGQGEPDVGAFADPVEQAAVAEEFQVTGEARLGLAEDFGELHDAERAAGREGEEPQAGGFSGGAKGGEELLHGGLYVT